MQMREQAARVSEDMYPNIHDYSGDLYSGSNAKVAVY